MSVSRRMFMKSVAASLATFVVPTARPRFDLMQFCSTPREKLLSRKYDLQLPYDRNDYIYATNGIVCVRVRPQFGDAVAHEGAAPPFEKLAWDHDGLRGWKSMPRLSPIMAANSQCLTCEGAGTDRGDMEECPKCNGFGCEHCRLIGSRPPQGSMWCHACGGTGESIRPSIVETADGLFFNNDVYEKVQRLNCEYVETYLPCCSSYVMQFKFDGGSGFLLPLSCDYAKRRIIDANIQARRS